MYSTCKSNIEQLESGNSQLSSYERLHSQLLNVATRRMQLTAAEVEEL